MISEPRRQQVQAFLRQPWVIGLALALCFVPWFATRVQLLYLYQTPPAQTVHPNYFTFHEMSQSWLEGKPLGEIDLNRMLMNEHRGILSDFITEKNLQDKYCNYVSLDPGYGIILAGARQMFSLLPDNYLRAVVLQVILDGLMLFALFLTFLRLGVIPATVTGMLYALSPVLAYNAIYPFQYFWEGWLVAMAMIALIWARRCALSERRVITIALIITAAVCVGFAMWVRSSALVAGVVFLFAFLSIPSLRRYCGVFFLAFALTIAPQVMRASAVAKHFALSTRMTWHTAYHALGNMPNKYGIWDDDLYVFTKTQNDYGIVYNYCDYSKHDEAARKEYMMMWDKDPGFVTRSILSRIMHDFLNNDDVSDQIVPYLIFFAAALAAILAGLCWRIKEPLIAGILGIAYLACFGPLQGMMLFFLALGALGLALVWRGELLFIAGTMALVYSGYCVALGIVYYMSAPYAYVADLCLLLIVPVFVAALIKMISAPNLFLALRIEGKAPLVKTMLTVLLVAALGFGVLLCVPPVRTYLFPARAYQYGWTLFGPPNRPDNRLLVRQWKALPQPQKEAFLRMVHKTVPATQEPEKDVARYFATNIEVIAYTDRADHNAQKTLFVPRGAGAGISQALPSVFDSILGWRASEISEFQVSVPHSWDGKAIHIKLVPTPERADVDYRGLGTEKFKRFNFDVTWLGPNELIARYNGYNCDGLRAYLAQFYGGYCPYDPRTGPSPLVPWSMKKNTPKTLTPALKPAH